MKHFSSEIKNPRCKLCRDRTDEAYCREKVKEDKLDGWVAPSWTVGGYELECGRPRPRAHGTAAGSSLDRLGTLSLPKRLPLQGDGGTGAEQTGAR
jgi:hypothetical protein